MAIRKIRPGSSTGRRGLLTVFALALAIPALAEQAVVSAENQACVACHQNQNRALHMEWERSKHACVERRTALPPFVRLAVFSIYRIFGVSCQ